MVYMVNKKINNYYKLNEDIFRLCELVCMDLVKNIKSICNYHNSHKCKL